MSLFTRKKINTTADVPAELADAYDAATPDAAAYMERAASQMAAEYYHADAAAAGKSFMVYPEERQRMYVEHLPELLARAEHLARLQAAKYAAWAAQRSAEIERENAERYTCPVCKEINKDLAPYLNIGLGSIADGMGAIRMCPPCRHTADLLYAQASATPERQHAVRAALEIPAPRN